jgi:hypothetical protein
MPQREVRKASPGRVDEADRIEDPVFKLIYKTARKRAATA